MCNVTHLPLIILKLLKVFDPLVRNGHCKSVVKPYASLRNGSAQSGHARHVFGNGDDIGVEGVEHVVCEHEIDQRFHVGIVAEVLVIASREGLAQAVMEVQHGRHTIETEAVEAVLLHPPPQIRQQESQNLPVPIVEQSAVPEVMLALASCMEILMICAVKVVDAIIRVGRRMRVHHIHQHHYAQLVSTVNQGLELLGRSTSATDSIEVGHVITKRCIVSVLHNSHNLYSGVTEVFDAG
mmetsp:Transcript_43995/g.71580  ORF Transcript_43995/g.71580 Transcript_43995/m.71580 type:complete len:239 (-) Transcript_43995:782-1498(-)